MTIIPPNIKSRRSFLRYGLPTLIAVGVLAPFTARGASLVAPRLIAAVDLNVYLGAPPPPRHEVIVERDRPSRNHVWVEGYWANRHGRHEWIAGHWELPPHGRTVWVAPRWEKRDRGYVFIEGYWAEPHHEHDNDHHDHH
ncbi:MAG TPA: YXWGXW repeat-containing protein [Lacunisphaera sp.]